ncbi:hypothetical protein BpOF4_07105 [Alkalihalophilus pseudofirmus OF4]|uniref:Uncharacterized protein n=1 Tax=Alkalihalophilus pseudofirmus (strain ATCC BAA-2126 / JCM 17055 / OF4) TaxID=398511 RepID=D3FPR9_ALKPO|nr:hypothetical protein BpOF4_07105 [Alkalihalophilus pseudofirmus OF4]
MCGDGWVEEAQQLTAESEAYFRSGELTLTQQPNPKI